MPGFDGTGPQGRGSMTGRGFGKCRPVYSADNQPVVISGPSENQESNENIQMNRQPVQGQTYGVGRGGIPSGCGRGRTNGGRGGRRGRRF